MELSEQTLTVLKNFATINPSIVFNPGSEIRTISPQKTVMSVATVPDDFPIQACIYDLSKFLAMCSIFNKPEIDFQNDKFCFIREGKQKTRFVFADISMAITPPKQKEVDIPSEDVKVTVTWADIQSVLKASSVLNLPEIAFVGRDGICYISSIDSSNPTSDSHEIEIGKTEDTFQLVIKTENLKLIPQDYQVTLCSKGISKFEGNNIKYFIAIESKSTYKKGN
jgi:hypothetical protein